MSLKGGERRTCPVASSRSRNTLASGGTLSKTTGLCDATTTCSSLDASRTAELLEGVGDVDLDALDVELPRGFGRD